MRPFPGDSLGFWLNLLVAPGSSLGILFSLPSLLWHGAQAPPRCSLLSPLLQISTFLSFSLQALHTPQLSAKPLWLFMALRHEVRQPACLTNLKVLWSLLALVFLYIQGLMINMCLDVNYQSSWEILNTFLLELKNITLSNVLILLNRIQFYR